MDSRYRVIPIIFLMILPLMVIPQYVAGEVVIAGVNVKAGTYNFYDVKPITIPVVVASTASLRIVINRTALGWLGDDVRLSFILDKDKFNPNVGGFFLRVSNVGDYGPEDPKVSPYGGVINIVVNSTLTDEYGNVVGNVTVIAPYVIIWLDLSRIDLSNVVYITNVYLEKYSYENLYNVPLRAKVFKAEAWDAAVSTNAFTVLEVFCSDVLINVKPFNVTYGNEVELKFSFEQLFNKISNAAGLSLNVFYNITRVTMYNRYNVSENYLLIEFNNGVVNYYGNPVFSEYAINYTNVEIIYNGTIGDFSPSIDDPNYDYLVSTYGFEVMYSYVNESVDISIIATSDCVNTIDSPYMFVRASLEVSTIEVTGNEFTNPGDYVVFLAHNVPYPYLGVEHYVTYLRLTNYTSFDLDTFIYLTYYSDGTISGTLLLPELPYGGYSYLVRLIFSNNKFIEDGYLTIAPYITVKVLTSGSAYAEDYNGYYKGRFITGGSSAPGDYIVVEGHGFLIVPEISVYLNEIKLTILHFLAHVNYGNLTMLIKIYPLVVPGSYTLRVGVPDSPNVAAVPLNVVIDPAFTKVLFNPSWGIDDEGYYIKHDKIGDPYLYFQVKYPFMYDNFYPYLWPYETYVEIISWPSTTFTFKLYNLDFGLTFEWFSVRLTYGYNFTSLTDREIRFLPYGNYTLREGTLVSVNDRVVFTVYMGVDVDVDYCRGGFFNVTVVGGAPNVNYVFSFNYSVSEVTYNVSLKVEPYWRGLFNITMLTDEYGVGFVSVPLTALYPSEYVSNVTWDTIVQLSLEGVGNITFTYVMSGSYLSMYPHGYYESIATIYDKDYTTRFYSIVDYNITRTYEAVGYIPRVYFTISVPEVISPGQDIVIQVFLHQYPVWDMLIASEWLIEEPEILGREVMMYTRLVDPLTNARVVDTTWFNLVVEDVDKDGIGEVWFVTKFKAPFVLGSDKTYRVDVWLFIVTVSEGTKPTAIEVNDTGCYVYLDINGTIVLKGYETYMMIGGDKQIVTVLGALYAEVINIRDNVVEIRALVNNVITLIEVDVMQLLRQINNTVATVYGEVVEVRRGVSTLLTNVSTLIDLVRGVGDNVSLILTCCRNVREIINRVEARVNETYNIVLQINGNLTSLINTVYNEVVPRFYELYNNVSLVVNATGEYVINVIRGRLDSVNESLHLLIITTKNELNATLYSLYRLVIDRISGMSDEIAARVITNITAYLDEEFSWLLMEINESSLNYTSKILASINATKDELKNTIYEFQNLILNKLEDVKANVTADVKAYIDAKSLWIITSLNETIRNHTAEILLNISGAKQELIDKLNSLLNTILGKIDSSTGDIKVYIDGKTQWLYGSLTQFIDDRVSTIRFDISDVNRTLSGLINLRADELRIHVDKHGSWIVGNVSNVRVAILTKLSEVNATLLNGILELKLGLINLATNVSTLLSHTRDIKLSLIQVNGSLATLLMGINNTLTVRINGTLSEIKSLVSDVGTKVSIDLKDAIDKLSKSLSDTTDLIKLTLKDMVTNVTRILDSFQKDTSRRLDDTQVYIGDRFDALSRELASRTDRLNVNQLLFSAAIVMIEIIILAILGYMLIRRPVG